MKYRLSNHAQLAAIITLTASFFAGCKSDKKTFDIADYEIGTDFYVDTVCTVGGDTICFLINPNYGQNILYNKEGILAYNPMLSVIPIDSTVFNVTSFNKDDTINFADSASVERLKAAYPPFDDFKLIVRGYANNGLQPAEYGISVQEADDRVRHYQALNDWIAMNLGDTVKEGETRLTLDSIGHNLANSFFDEFDDRTADTETEFVYSGSRSFLVYDRTQEYVTFMDYFNDYAGGPHANWGVSLVTFSLIDGVPVDAEYLYKPGSEDAIEDLLYEAIAENKDFCDAHYVRTAAQVKRLLAPTLHNNLPLPALTHKGIVYGFSPYEIGSYSEGEYAFNLPYDKVAKYLTDKGKKLLMSN